MESHKNVQLLDLRLYSNRCMAVVGPTQSGKTEYVKRFIQYRNQLFRIPPKRVVWYYGGYQPSLHKDLLTLGILVKHGLPNEQDLVERDLIVLDDLLLESVNSSETTQLFTRAAHHRNCFIIFISQNLFSPGSQSRTRRLNTHYFLLFKNPSDRSQISYFARQQFPKHPQVLIDMYNDATEIPYTPFFIDATQDTADKLRFRSNILPDDPKPYTLYIPNVKH